MTNAILTLLPQDGFRRTPWKNGGGVTIDIADAYLPGVAIGSWEGMIWRLGRTAIVVAAPFSDLTGFERLQIVVVGSGLVLETPGGDIDLSQPFTPVRYDGGTPIMSRIENGPVEVINLIADRALCEIELVVADGPTSVQLKVGTHIVYAPGSAVSGSCEEAAFAVENGSALRIDAAADARLVVTHGRAVIATIVRREN